MKLEVDAGLQHRLTDAIPRRNRRGLIEACRNRRTVPWFEPGFPGEIAGASLKRVEASSTYREAHGIPRRNRRGLIEAR